MGDRMPVAFSAMAKAAHEAGMIVEPTVAALSEGMEKGEVKTTNALIKNFGENLSEAVGGGLEEKLKSNRVAMSQLFAQAQLSANEFFAGGYADGLTEFFQTSTTFLKDNQDLWKALGAIIGSVLRGVSNVIKAVTPVLETFGFVLKKVTDLFGDFSGVVALFLSPFTIMGISKVTNKFSTFIPLIGKIRSGFLALTAAATRFALPVIGAFAALEEIINLFTGEKAGILRDDTQKGSFQTERVLNFLGFDTGKNEEPDMSSFTGRLENVGQAILKGSPVEKFQAGLDFWKGNLNQVIEVVIDGEKVGEAVVNSESGQEGVKRMMRNDSLNNY